MHAGGRADLSISIKHNAETRRLYGPDEFDNEFIFSVFDGKLNYEPFPYPLEQLHHGVEHADMRRVVRVVFRGSVRAKRVNGGGVGRSAGARIGGGGIAAAGREGKQTCGKSSGENGTHREKLRD